MKPHIFRRGGTWVIRFPHHFYCPSRPISLWDAAQLLRAHGIKLAPLVGAA